MIPLFLEWSWYSLWKQGYCSLGWNCLCISHFHLLQQISRVGDPGSKVQFKEWVPVGPLPEARGVGCWKPESRNPPWAQGPGQGLEPRPWLRGASPCLHTGEWKWILRWKGSNQWTLFPPAVSGSTFSIRSKEPISSQPPSPKNKNLIFFLINTCSLFKKKKKNQTQPGKKIHKSLSPIRY